MWLSVMAGSRVVDNQDDALTLFGGELAQGKNGTMASRRFAMQTPDCLAWQVQAYR